MTFKSIVIIKRSSRERFNLIYTINNRILYKNNQFILHLLKEFIIMITIFILL